MNMLQGRTYDSLQRVPEFLDAHADVLGAIVTSEGRKDVDAAIIAVQAHRTMQGTAIRELAGHKNKQLALAKELSHSHMLPIAKFARGKLRGLPGYAELTKAVDVAAPKKLLADARSMAKVAAGYVDRFVSAGMAADTVDKLSAAADALDEAIKQRIGSHQSRKASTDSIDALLQQGRDGVAVLDALITQLLKSNDPLLATWKSESRIQDKPGKVRTKPVAATTPQPVKVTATPASASVPVAVAVPAPSGTTVSTTPSLGASAPQKLA
jgi:hypothetical protein